MIEQAVVAAADSVKSLLFTHSFTPLLFDELCRHRVLCESSSLLLPTYGSPMIPVEIIVRSLEQYPIVQDVLVRRLIKQIT